MRHVLSWPKPRALHADTGALWIARIAPGELVLSSADGEVLRFTDPGELRAFAMQAHAAAIDRDLAAQAAAAKASTDRRLARQRAGQPTGLRHSPFTDAPEPPAHMEALA